MSLADGYLAPLRILSEEQCDILLKDYEKFTVSITVLFPLSFVKL